MKSDVPSAKFTVMSANDLRAIVSELISSTIDTHRASRAVSDEAYRRPYGEPTEEEINDFVISNPLYDTDIADALTDPGLLGFDFPSAIVPPQALAEFRANTSNWSTTNEWLAADRVRYHVLAALQPDETVFWKPTSGVAVSSFTRSRSALLIAGDLLKQGRLLSELDWRSFENLIGDLLEREGWQVNVTRPSRDGGVDVVACIKDPILGDLRTLWQGKKYGPTNKVRLAEVRELAGLVDIERATKGVMVTTSRLTRDAIDWVKRDTYRLSAMDGAQIEDWVKRYL